MCVVCICIYNMDYEVVSETIVFFRFLRWSSIWNVRLSGNHPAFCCLRSFAIYLHDTMCWRWFSDEICSYVRKHGLVFFAIFFAGFCIPDMVIWWFFQVKRLLRRGGHGDHDLKSAPTETDSWLSQRAGSVARGSAQWSCRHTSCTWQRRRERPACSVWCFDASIHADIVAFSSQSVHPMLISYISWCVLMVLRWFLLVLYLVGGFNPSEKILVSWDYYSQYVEK